MKNRILLPILLLAVSGISLNTMADDDDDDDRDDRNGGKVVLCHKEKNSISVGAAGLSAHLGHGDTEGRCGEVVEPEPEDPSRDVAAVMMHCVAGEDGVNVDTYSSSVDLDDLTPEISSNCAKTLADFINGGFMLRSVTGSGDSGTDYLLLGKAEKP